MKKKNSKTTSLKKALSKTPDQKPGHSSRDVSGDTSPAQTAASKTPEGDDRAFDESPYKSAAVPITNQDEQERITNQSTGQTSEEAAETSDREHNQGERMGPEYISDDSEIVDDAAEHKNREAQ
jgi:hypothetical protein